MGKFWITRTGEHILVSEMSDNHLLNSYYMMLRNGDSWKEQDSLACLMGGGGGEMAEYYSGLDSQRIGEMETVDYLRETSEPFRNLEEEVRNRGLIVDVNLREYEDGIYDKFTCYGPSGNELMYTYGHPKNVLEAFTQNAQILANTLGQELTCRHTDYEEFIVHKTFTVTPENK